MDMARVLIIKTPQKYKKTTHSARISPFILCFFPTAIFDGWRDGGMGDGCRGFDVWKRTKSRGAGM